jgi:molybdopterin synthase sulfur carrier subunit
VAVTVLFFANIREKLGKNKQLVDIKENISVAELWQRVANIPLPANTLAAVNQEYVPLSQPVQDGDEVAFFPPVTGG